MHLGWATMIRIPSNGCELVGALNLGYGVYNKKNTESYDSGLKGSYSFTHKVRMQALRFPFFGYHLTSHLDFSAQ